MGSAETNPNYTAGTLFLGAGLIDIFNQGGAAGYDDTIDTDYERWTWLTGGWDKVKAERKSYAENVALQKRKQALKERNAALIESEKSARLKELNTQFEADDTGQLKTLVKVMRGQITADELAQMKIDEANGTSPEGSTLAILKSMDLTTAEVENWNTMDQPAREKLMAKISSKLGTESQSALLQFQAAEFDQASTVKKQALATQTATANNDLFKTAMIKAGDDIQARGLEAEALAGAGPDSESRSIAGLNFVLTKEQESVNALIGKLGENNYSSIFSGTDPAGLATRDLAAFSTQRDSLLDTIIPNQVTLDNNRAFQSYMVDINKAKDMNALYWTGAAGQIDKMGASATSGIGAIDRWYENMQMNLESDQINLDANQYKLDAWNTDLQTYDAGEFMQDISTLVQVGVGVMDLATGGLGMATAMGASDAWKWGTDAKGKSTSQYSLFGAWANMGGR